MCTLLWEVKIYNCITQVFVGVRKCWIDCDLDIIRRRKTDCYCGLIVGFNQLQMICQRFDRGQERWDEWDGWDRCELYNTYSINGGPAFYNSQSKYKASSCWIDIAQQSGYCDINVDQLGFVRSIIGGFDNERCTGLAKAYFQYSSQSIQALRKMRCKY